MRDKMGLASAWKHLLDRLLHRIPYIGPRLREREQLIQEMALLRKGFPLGHFHSPIPSPEEIRQDEARIFRPASFAGLDMNVAHQLELLHSLRSYYADIRFPDDASADYRFYFRNIFFSYGDAVTLFCMLRHLRPRRMVEIGSGFSTCAAMDTNERFLDNSMRITCVEPYPERLLSLSRETDPGRAFELLPKRVQEVENRVFEELQAGDILFIDSSHVSKVGSDLNHLLFEVIPLLQPGVYVHFHDIFADFEYPRTWLLDSGWAWNECYILRAFLQYNTTFRVAFFLPYLASRHSHELNSMPLTLKDHGSGLWLVRA